MLLPKRNVNYLIKIILLVSCVIHISSIIETIFYPNLPSIKVYKKKLSNLEFPLSFRVCVEVNNDAKEYQKVGYRNKYDFIRGKNLYNDSMIGWAGMKNDGYPFGIVGGI